MTALSGIDLGNIIREEREWTLAFNIQAVINQDTSLQCGWILWLTGLAAPLPLRSSVASSLTAQNHQVFWLCGFGRVSQAGDTAANTAYYMDSLRCRPCALSYILRKLVPAPSEQRWRLAMSSASAFDEVDPALVDALARHWPLDMEHGSEESFLGENHTVHTAEAEEREVPWKWPPH
jgi:hypothetical protein